MKSAPRQIRKNLALCECATGLTNIVPRGSANNHIPKLAKLFGSRKDINDLLIQI